MKTIKFSDEQIEITKKAIRYKRQIEKNNAKESEREPSYNWENTIPKNNEEWAELLTNCVYKWMYQQKKKGTRK